MTDTAPGTRVPLVDYLVLDDGEPYLVAWESPASGALYVDRHNADAKSGQPGFRRRRLSRTGTVHTFTIVHRAAPGVAVPYVSAVVDLDGGGCVKANLVGVDADPEQVRVGLRVRLVTFPVGTDQAGVEAVGFGFEPAEGT